MCKVLFVAWRSPNIPQWGPIGRFDRHGENYRFVYTKGATTLAGFEPFLEMPHLEEVYESDELLPIFQNRMLSPQRSEYRDFLIWSGFDPDVTPDPLDLLGVTEGKRATDQLELFPCPQPDKDKMFRLNFYLHGIKYLPTAAKNEIKNCKPGDALAFMFDVSNVNDPDAVAVRTTLNKRRFLIGYLPRYLARDVKKLFTQTTTKNVSLVVGRVNSGAPMQQLMLCKMAAPWPNDFSPCQGEEFQPIPRLAP
ncbi:MAG: HIRAN domain-containing protein [Planctomycetes bacterium]|nr:HIRAN domain-containing protein [Planctomycetota bacterium]